MSMVKAALRHAKHKMCHLKAICSFICKYAGEFNLKSCLNVFDLFYHHRGISWCDDSLALVYESWYKTRRTRTWVISPGSKDSSPRILFDRSSEDVYSDPGSPMFRRTPAGTYVIAKIKKGHDDESYYIILNGSGATPEGNIPFLDLFDM